VANDEWEVLQGLAGTRSYRAVTRELTGDEHNPRCGHAARHRASRDITLRATARHATAHLVTC
jgi:hypothetical protein